MKNNCLGLSVEQIEFACKQVRTWMEICESQERPVNAAAVDHSSLLRRLFSGKEALPEPPPLRFSYPAWELVEANEIEIQEFVEDEHGIRIDQHRGYSWVDETQKILTYDRLGLFYQLQEREVVPDPSVLKEGLNPEDFKYKALFLKKWAKP